MARKANVSVKRRENETTDSLIRRFEEECFQSGIFEEMKRNRYFMTKAEKRKYKAGNRKDLNW